MSALDLAAPRVSRVKKVRQLEAQIDWRRAGRRSRSDGERGAEAGASSRDFFFGLTRSSSREPLLTLDTFASVPWTSYMIAQIMSPWFKAASVKT
jgi:hypothetical protein